MNALDVFSVMFEETTRSSQPKPALPQTIELLGMPLAVLSHDQLLAHISAALANSVGGWVVTANLDILLHFERNALAREAYLAADLRVADGMPLVWASRLQRSPLPERVAGSTLTVALAASAARAGWRVLLLGGSPGTAERAAEAWRKSHPELAVLGDSGHKFTSPPNDDEVQRAIDLVESHGSQIVLVGLGSPKQELLIQRMRSRLPGTWFVGVGGTFSFLAGDVTRAPVLLQGIGLEWLHRLVQDPKRLGKRYLLDNMPVFFRLMAASARKRV